MDFSFSSRSNTRTNVYWYKIFLRALKNTSVSRTNGRRHPSQSCEQLKSSGLENAWIFFFFFRSDTLSFLLKAKCEEFSSSFFPPCKHQKKTYHKNESGNVRPTWKNIKKKNERKWRPSGWWLSASQMSNIYNNFVRVYKVPNTIPGNSVRSPWKWLFSIYWVHHGLQLPVILDVLKHNKCSAVTLVFMLIRLIGGLVLPSTFQLTV